MKKSTVDSVEMPAKISIRLTVASDLCSCTSYKWHCAISKWCMRNLHIPDLNPVADFMGWAGGELPPHSLRAMVAPLNRKQKVSFFQAIKINC